MYGKRDQSQGRINHAAPLSLKPGNPGYGKSIDSFAPGRRMLVKFSLPLHLTPESKGGFIIGNYRDPIFEKVFLHRTGYSEPYSGARE